MSQYTPANGSFFYVTNLKGADRSYEATIFRALASDQLSVLGEIVFKDYFASDDKRRLLRRDVYAFIPVGADVATALNLMPAERAEA